MHMASYLAGYPRPLLLETFRKRGRLRFPPEVVGDLFRRVKDSSVVGEREDVSADVTRDNHWVLWS